MPNQDNIWDNQSNRRLKCSKSHLVESKYRDIFSRKQMVMSRLSPLESPTTYFEFISNLTVIEEVVNMKNALLLNNNIFFKKTKLMVTF